MERGERPWGTYTVLDEKNGYKIKRIEVKPGQAALELPGSIALAERAVQHIAMRVILGLFRGNMAEFLQPLDQRV